MMHRSHLSSLATMLLLAASQVQAAGELKVLPTAGKGVAVVFADQPGKWLVLTVDRKTFFFSFPEPTLLEGGKVCLWEGPPGVYGVVFDAQDGTRQTTNVVLGPVTPEPGPGPNPNPDPQPVPSTFKQQVKVAFDLVKSSREKAVPLGKNYRTIAAQAAANPASWDPAAMQDAVKTRHAEVLTTTEMTAWQPFWPALVKALVALKLEPTDLQGHVKAFVDIADVLEATGAR